MGRLIDADETIKELKRQRDQYEAHDWVNLKESLINDGYDFAITDVEHMPTVEAISKADYEARLKADMVAMLKELLEKFEKLDPDYECNTYYAAIRDCSNLTQQKIDKLKENINK